MRLILQRVSRATVTVETEVVGAIGRGLLVLVGVEPGDDGPTIARAAGKIAALRVFDDADGRMNLDLAAVGGAVLLVSQFTLLANLDKGRRPSYAGAAPPAVAEPLVEELAVRLRRLGCTVETGRFGARMQVALVNDGPVTLLLDVVGGGERDRRQETGARD